MKWHQGTLFPSVIKLDGARIADPDLSTDIEKVRYKIVRTLPSGTALDRRVVRHPPQPRDIPGYHGDSFLCRNLGDQVLDCSTCKRQHHYSIWGQNAIMKKATKPILKCFTSDDTRRSLKGSRFLSSFGHSRPHRQA